MKGERKFLTITSVDARFGSRSVMSIPISQIREIKECDFNTTVTNDHLRDVKSGITMAGKDSFYWATETRDALINQIEMPYAVP